MPRPLTVGHAHQENCLVRTGTADNSGDEERVLYRLLSGMHAATNVHIARYYHAPSKRKGREEHEPILPLAVGDGRH